MSCDQMGEGTLESRLLDNALPKSARLNKQHDFTAVFRCNNRRVGDRYWTVLALPREPQDGSMAEAPAYRSARLGLAIAKKRARRAVDRNRLKRIVRESFRQHQAMLSGFDIIVMNRDSCVGASNADLNRSLQRLWKKLPEAQSKDTKDKRNTGHRVRQRSHESDVKRLSGEQGKTKSG